jgi:hypothetical protein
MLEGETVCVYVYVYNAQHDSMLQNHYRNVISSESSCFDAFF